MGEEGEGKKLSISIWEFSKPDLGKGSIKILVEFSTREWFQKKSGKFHWGVRGAAIADFTSRLKTLDFA